MMLGVPVASSQTTSLPEVLGEAALYFDPYQIESMREAVRCLWDDAVSRQSLQAKGYERVQHFSWERMGRETADIYKNV
jgi:glycosyltransferase involved in cell wall biosynthesis